MTQLYELREREKKKRGNYGHTGRDSYNLKVDIYTGKRHVFEEYDRDVAYNQGQMED